MEGLTASHLGFILIVEEVFIQLSIAAFHDWFDIKYYTRLQAKVLIHPHIIPRSDSQVIRPVTPYYKTTGLKEFGQPHLARQDRYNGEQNPP